VALARPNISSLGKDFKMSSTLRLSIITVMLLSTTALGLIAYNSMNAPVVQAPPETPAPVAPVASKGYFVATKPLRVGTLAKQEDFKFIPLTSGEVAPSDIEGRDAIARLRGSLVRRFLDTDKPVTSKDIVSPQDRGFLAGVLEAGKRAISIEVDTESGVSRLIWPGDHVDVVLTQEIDKDNPRRTMSETILQDVRVIAIDQEIEQGQSAPASNAPGAPSKPPKHPVSLEVKPEEVQKITVAKKLGTLSLAIRPDESLDAPVTEARAGTGGSLRTTLDRDVSPEIARQNEESARQKEENARQMARQRACAKAKADARKKSTVRVYAGGKVTEHIIETNDPVTSADIANSCPASLEEAPTGSATVGTVRIPVDASGHFYPAVTINGMPVRFMADTGATLVALSLKDAQKIGIDPQSLQFTGKANTANGSVQSASVTLPEITIEGIVLRDVRASCCVTGVSLLGMSALGQLGLEMKDGWMFLSPKS
jgi:pilus assembly protein CpaB